MFSLETFGQRIRECRLQANMTQQVLGQTIGLSKQAINDIEKGRNSTKVDKALMIADLFDTTVEYLGGVTDDPGPYPIRRQL